MDTLILACSVSKQVVAAPALDLYKGRAFDLVRRQAERAGFRVLVLSAKHGLLLPAKVIEPYDQKMNLTRARQLSVSTQDIALLDTMPGAIHVYGGALYRSLVGQWAAMLGRELLEVKGAARGCGDHYSALIQFMGRTVRQKRKFCPNTGLEYFINITT